MPAPPQGTGPSEQQIQNLLAKQTDQIDELIRKQGEITRYFQITAILIGLLGFWELVLFFV